MTTLTPAYGRDYRTAKAARADFDDGKDFIISDAFHPYDGKPTNIDDWIGQTVLLRFCRLTKTCTAKVLK